MGDTAFNFVRDHMNDIVESKSYDSGHHVWTCKHCHGYLNDKQVNLIGVPHLSKYDIKKYPDVIKWIKGKSGQIN